MKHQIAAWHIAHVSNGPTEAANNLIKRVKRVSVYRPSVRRRFLDPPPALSMGGHWANLDYWG